MGRSRYKIYEPTHPHFVTYTILNWLPIFTRKESVGILLENHIHLVVQSDDIARSMRHFKSFTDEALLKLLQKENAETLLKQFQLYKKAHKKDKTYQLWQEGYLPKLIQTDAIMLSKIQYMHENPVKRGYVDEAIHWRYNSVRDYTGMTGLIEVERFW